MFGKLEASIWYLTCHISMSTSWSVAWVKIVFTLSVAKPFNFHNGLRRFISSVLSTSCTWWSM
jgi:hypothetical protein